MFSPFITFKTRCQTIRVHSKFLTYPQQCGCWGKIPQLCQKVFKDYPNRMCQSAFDNSSSFKSCVGGGGGELWDTLYTTPLSIISSLKTGYNVLSPVSLYQLSVWRRIIKRQRLGTETIMICFRTFLPLATCTFQEAFHFLCIDKDKEHNLPLYLQRISLPLLVH